LAAPSSRRKCLAPRRDSTESVRVTYINTITSGWKAKILTSNLWARIYSPRMDRQSNEPSLLPPRPRLLFKTKRTCFGKMTFRMGRWRHLHPRLPRYRLRPGSTSKSRPQEQGPDEEKASLAASALLDEERGRRGFRTFGRAYHAESCTKNGGGQMPPNQASRYIEGGYLSLANLAFDDGRRAEPAKPCRTKGFFGRRIVQHGRRD